MSPTDERGSDQPDAGRSGWRITRWELLVIVVVIAVALALLLPAIQIWREASRRMACQANLKQIGLAIHNYSQAQKVFPPGTVCTSEPIQPGNQYDVWKEAAETGVGTAKKPRPAGHGLSAADLSYMEGARWGGTDWNWNAGISNAAENIEPPSLQPGFGDAT